MFLQGIGKEFVHLRDAGRDAKIDCSVANFNNETTENIWVDLYRMLDASCVLCAWGKWGESLDEGRSYLVCHLELLALADVLRLGNSGLEA